MNDKMEIDFQRNYFTFKRHSRLKRTQGQGDCDKFCVFNFGCFTFLSNTYNNMKYLNRPRNSNHLYVSFLFPLPSEGVFMTMDLFWIIQSYLMFLNSSSIALETNKN